MNQNVLRHIINQELRAETELFDHDLNIKYLRAAIIPLIRGATNIYDKIAKFSELFSRCMRVISTTELMAKEGKLRKEILFLFVMNVWRTVNYEDWMLVIQNEMIKTEAAFDKLLQPLEIVSSYHCS